jgi:GNAT superfamily N-acetyltransferase/DNA-binding MarR family transcriptional regulator
MDREAVAIVRRFSRAVAREIGALDSSYLGQGRPLGSARVLCAIGEAGRDLADLRSELEIDAALLSRLIGGLAGEGLVVVTAGGRDRRRRRAAWTAAGRAEAARYDALSDARAERILGAQGRGAGRLLAAMELVAAALNRAHVRIDPAEPDSPAARACVARYHAEIAARFEGGFDPARALQPKDEELRPPRGVLLLATSDGQPLGCVAVRLSAPGTAELKRLWVAPASRGLGVAGRLVAAAEAEARKLGAATLRLDTNRALTEAIALYRARGFAEVPAFNAEPFAHHWFAKAL